MVSRLLLAPMAGYCDLGFRMAVRSLGGLGLACTELVNSQALVRASKTTLRMIRTCQADQPLCVQLYGVEADVMAEAARQTEGYGAAVIDINMGCPAYKVTKHNGGAGWLCDPPGAARLAEAVVKAVHVPVTVKVRLGPDENHIVAPQMARMFAEVGVAAVIVHGRTTAQRFRGKVSLDRIAEVVVA
ncbi:MAG: tRNA-dihydrouridine synthase family protein, partial [Phycisphaerae bacterium]|nr:tRNA-dihydrouridine synthase family protein [Phycisphaerae bacterium]